MTIHQVQRGQQSASTYGRLLAVAVMSISFACSIAGCSSVGNTKCSEFANQSFSERQSTMDSLLDAHNLKQSSVSNTLGLMNALNTFCGTSGLGHETAKKNADLSIDKAVDWSSKTW